MIRGGDTPIQETLYIKAVYDQSRFAFGFLTTDKIFHWQMFNENAAKLASLDGVVQSSQISQPAGYWSGRLMQQLRNRWDVENYVVEVDSALSPTSTIPNWQNYEIVE